MKEINDEQYMVDIPMCVYNHEKYIEQAIRGVLDQNTNFNYRLIIGDDYSTDNSRLIIKSYADRFPDKIKVLFHEKNLGPIQNSIILFDLCIAKYVALLDGDDYWIDPNKLQKQVDFLESNPRLSGCFSDTIMVDNAGVLIGDALFEIHKKEIHISKIGTFWIPTVSVCFRASYLGSLMKSERIEHLINGDIFLYFLLSQYGNFAYVQTIPSCYRQHPGGVWSNLKIINRYEKNLLSDYIIYDELMTENKKYIIPRLKNNYSWQLDHYKKNEHISGIVKFFKLNFSALIIRKQYGLAFSLMVHSFYILALRIIDRVKRIFSK